MNGFNRAIIAGNLTNDPDLRYTVNKRAFARFRVAVNNNFRNANGELQENTEYINVVVWGPMAENCGKYLKKGRPVLVEGRIQTSSFEAKDGSGKKYMTEINASNVVFLGSGSGQGSSSGQSSNSGGYTQMPPMSGDSDFGRSIGESNFGGDMSQGFAGGNTNDETDIPF